MATWTTTEETVTWTAVDDPSVTWAVNVNPTVVGGGAVDSVNGDTGVVVLTAADVGATTSAEVDAQIDAYHLPFIATTRVHVPVSNFGGTVGGGTATVAAFAGIATGRNLWLQGQSNSDDDGFYVHDGGGEFTLADVQPFSEQDYIGREIVVGVDAEYGLAPTLWVVVGGEVTNSATRLAARPDELNDYATVEASTLADVRQLHADELLAEITNVFRGDLGGNGRWSTPSLTAGFTTGISYRCLRIPRRPPTTPFFAEYFTQPHDSGAGSWDNFEGADLWPDNSFDPSNGTPTDPGVIPGQPRDFHEQTEQGGITDGSGWWPDLLLASDQAIETMTDITFSTGVGRKWLRVPYELDDGGTYHTDADDGAVFRLMSTFTSAKFESISQNGDGGWVAEDWWIGNNYSGDIARVIVRDGLDGTLIADPDASLVTPGATAFVDGAGNTWTAGSAAQVVELNPTDPWVTITDTTLGADAASFEVDTTGYNDLEVVLTGRGASTAGPTVGMRVRFNNDSGSNYLSNTSAVTTAWNGVGTMPASQTNTDRNGVWAATISLGHTSTETTAVCVGTHRTSTSSTGTVPQTLAGYYTNVSAAITSMSIYPSSGDWAAGTRLLVRGRV